MTFTIGRYIRFREAVEGGRLEVFLIAYPTVIAMLGHAFLGFADTMMVGALGTEELGAVGFTNIVYFTILALFMGTVQIVNTFASQETGAKHPARAAQWAPRQGDGRHDRTRRRAGRLGHDARRAGADLRVSRLGQPNAQRGAPAPGRRGSR